MASWIKGVYHAAPCHDVNSTPGTKVIISVHTGSPEARTLRGLGYKMDYILTGCHDEQGDCLDFYILPEEDYNDLYEEGMIPHSEFFKYAT